MVTIVTAPDCRHTQQPVVLLRDYLVDQAVLCQFLMLRTFPVNLAGFRNIDTRFFLCSLTTKLDKINPPRGPVPVIPGNRRIKYRERQHSVCIGGNDLFAHTRAINLLPVEVRQQRPIHDVIEHVGILTGRVGQTVNCRDKFKFDPREKRRIFYCENVT